MESASEEGRSASESERPRREFELDGKKYELPLLSTFNLDEERILYVYADTVMQDLMPLDPGLDEGEKLIQMTRQLQRFRNPDLKRAVAHVAYRRAHPDMSDQGIQKALGNVNALALDIAMFAEVDAGPPESNSQKSSSNEKNESEHSDGSSSGSPTESTSPSPVLTLANTGTSESDISSPPSAQAIPV